MRVEVKNLWTETQAVFEGHPALVARQLCVRFPFIGCADRREPVSDLLARLNAQQAFEASIVERGDGVDACTAVGGGR